MYIYLCPVSRRIYFQEICEELKECSGQLYAVKADITREEDIQGAFRWVERKLGGADILVNNAGMSISTDVVGKGLHHVQFILVLKFFVNDRLLLLVIGRLPSLVYVKTKQNVLQL